jgi:multiple sugar transport system substrate-binding protein
MKSKKTTLWIALSVLLIAAVALSACSPAVAPTPEKIVETKEVVVTKEVPKEVVVTKEVVVQATEAPAYEGPKARVNLWHTIPTDTETYFVGELMPKFNALHPECNVVIRNLGVEDASIVRTGLALPLDDANRPHLWWIASSETGAYVEADVLADVDSWLNAHPDIKNNIIPALLTLSSWEGKVRSIPWMTNNTAMWINVDAFEKAGVPIPSQDPEKTWTWEEFADAMKKVTAANPGMKGFLETVNTGWDFWTYHSWYGAAGGDVSGLAKLDSPESIKAIQFHKDLMDAGVAATTPTGWDAAPWYAGQVAVMANGPWNFPKLSTFTDFKFTVVPYPRDVKPATNLGGDQLFIGKTPTPEQEACAFAFAEWILTDEFQIAFQKQSGNLPVTKSAAENQEYQDHLAKYPFMAGFVNQTPYGVSRPPLPEFNDISNAFTLAWDSVILQGADPTSAMTELQQEVNQILGQ